MLGTMQANRFFAFQRFLSARMALWKYGYAILGLLIGITLGGGLGIYLFKLTGQGLYVAITGLAGGVGLSVGAGFDQHRHLL